MTRRLAQPADAFLALRPLPGWIVSAPAETLDDAAFRSVTGLARALDGVTAERIALSLDTRGPTPVDRAAAVLSTSIGQHHVLPLLSLALTPRDIVRPRDALRAVTQKLRAKGAARAVDLFLAHDALAPVALAKDTHCSLSDRAARRLCDQLATLGALRKLTGRDLIGRLAEQDLIRTGPREPRRGAPDTFVTTETFLAAFGMESLHDLPDMKQMNDAWFAAP